MPLTLPDLDDRRYEDLVEEARSLLVSYAPALTNHNPSDPVVTLTEAFAYVTEVLLFRLNNVTDASRIAFLKLLNDSDWAPPTTAAELDAKTRSTVLKLRSTDRAVTPEDFETLALSTDADVVRAHCISERNLDVSDPALKAVRAPGHVSVVIVPRGTANLATLVKKVADYLEPRRLLGTRVHVVGPRFVSLRVRLTLHALPGASGVAVMAGAVDALRQFFDQVTGRDGSGWPFGRDVFVSEIYRLLDSLPGVDFVTRTLDTSNNPLDELITGDGDATRLQRNSAGDLISVGLAADELVQSAIADADVNIDITVVVPTIGSTSP
jgi:phage-related baseplate assembly protein